MAWKRGRQSIQIEVSRLQSWVEDNDPVLNGPNGDDGMIRGVAGLYREARSIRELCEVDGFADRLAPKGAHGRAAVRAIGRTKTTGNFAKIEAAKTWIGGNKWDA